LQGGPKSLAQMRTAAGFRITGWNSLGSDGRQRRN
jgi:hypothetical protein